MQVYDKKLWNDNIGYESSNYLRITKDANTTVVVKDQNNTTLSDGDLLIEGTVITITATPSTNYTLAELTVNGASFTSGSTYTVYTGVRINALSTNQYDISIYADDHTTLTVMKGGEEVEDGDYVTFGDVLTITASYSTGYEKDGLTVDGNAFTSGQTYTVAGHSVEIDGTSKAQAKTLTITQTNASVVVMVGETQVNSGEPIYYDDVLTVTATASDGYTLGTFTINGVNATSPATHTVTANVVIVATGTLIQP